MAPKGLAGLLCTATLLEQQVGRTEFSGAAKMVGGTKLQESAFGTRIGFYKSEWNVAGSRNREPNPVDTQAGRHERSLPLEYEGVDAEPDIGKRPGERSLPGASDFSGTNLGQARSATTGAAFENRSEERRS